jgi:photosystem II stability/assembly factor-like uncharacterized protein
LTLKTGAPRQRRPGPRRRVGTAWFWAAALLLVLDALAVVNHSSSSRRPLSAVAGGPAFAPQTGVSPGAPAATPATALLPAQAPAQTPAPAQGPSPLPSVLTTAPPTSRPVSGKGAPTTTSPSTRTNTAALGFQLGALADLQFASASTGWISGQQDSQAFIVATRDGGASWEAQCIPVATGSIWRVTSIDADRVWAVGSDLSRGAAVALRSTDGGRHWAAGSLPPGIATLFSAAFLDAQQGWAVGYLDSGNDGASGAVLHTGDGGVTWSAQPLPQQTAGTLYDVSFADGLHGWVAGVASDRTGLILATSDGGSTWVRQQPAPAVAELRGVHFVSPTRGWAVGWDFSGGAPSAGVILATADGGATWARQAHDPDTTLWGVGFPDASHGWVVGQRQGGAGEVLVTSDGGATWQRQDAQAATVLQKVTFPDSLDGWAGGQQVAVLRTNDGGATWQPVHVVASQAPCA